MQSSRMRNSLFDFIDGGDGRITLVELILWRWTANQSIKVLRLTVISELMMVLSRYAQSFVKNFNENLISVATVGGPPQDLS